MYGASMKLNQVLATHTDIRDRGMRALTTSYHDGQRAQQLEGLERTYQPDDDEGEKFPSEGKVLQTRMKEVIESIHGDVIVMAQSAALRDAGNCVAKADVVIDGEVILKDVPATYLLWLEKHLLAHLKTFASKLPTLPTSETWEWDDNRNCYVSRPTQTLKSKKEPRVITKAEATEHHPAQAEIVYEDRRVGVWTSIKFSGALPQKEVKGIQNRVQVLIEAVKKAREEANSIAVPTIPNYGSQVLGFIFG